MLCFSFLPVLGCDGETSQRASVDVQAVTAAENAVVYGADGRRDAWELASEDLNVVRDHVVTMVRRDELIEMQDDVFFAPTESLGNSIGLCPDERFIDQPTNGECSATLIAPQLVLTAGHCVEALSCSQMSLVFDYALYDAMQGISSIGIDDKYDCADVLYEVNQGGSDWAVLELDRPVVGRAPAPFVSPNHNLDPLDPIILVGSPSGIPTKLDSGGLVSDPNPPGQGDYFYGKPDAFGGNSGSGVYTADRLLVGVLTFGEQDYAFDQNAGCFRVNMLDDFGPQNGEGIMYARRAIVQLCNDFPEKAPNLCAAESTCAPCDDAGQCPGASQVCALGGSIPGTEVTDLICTDPCAGPGDCQEGFFCNAATSLCMPDIQPQCFGDDVGVVNTCGFTELSGAPCESGLTCIAGQCVPVEVGATCDAPIDITAVNQSIVQNTSGAGNDERGFCGGDTGPEQVYTFILEAPLTNFVAETNGDFDTLIYLRGDCNAPNEIACDDDGAGNLGSRLELPLEPGRYHLFVDAYNSNSGEYVLDLEFNTDSNCVDCQIGESICTSETSFVTCTFDEMQGCTVQQVTTGCLNGNICVDGACTADCIDECDFETPLCIDENTAGYCGDFDGDGCRELTVTEFCSPNEICVDFFCVEACTDDCDVGDKRCFMEAAEEECVYDPELDCNRWEIGEICSPPQGSCVDGQCFGCADGCAVGDQQCADSMTREACTFDQDTGCSAWVIIDVCDLGEMCTDGACNQTGCIDDCPEPFEFCDGDFAERCFVGPDGCLDYDSDICDAGEVCMGGDCVDEECGSSECVLGQSVCADDQSIQTCVADADGCPAWTTASCPAQTECANGACVATCVGVCTLGDTRCTEAGDIEACVLGGDCTVWSAPSPCPGGGACLNDQCVGDCADQCTPGDALCVNDHAYRDCIDVGSCAVWGTPQYCLGDDVCQGAACVTPPTAPDAGPPVFDGGFFKDDPPDRVRIVPTQNCEQSGAPVSLLTGVMLLGLLATRRRRSRECT